jgi:hypothetical protein
VKVTSELLTVELFDGRRVSLTISLFPTLAEAAPSERAKWELCGAGTGIHWPLLDYELSAGGLLRREPEAPGIHRAKTAATYPPTNPAKLECWLRKLTIPPLSPAGRAGRPSVMPRSLESTQRRNGAETQRFPLLGPSTRLGMSEPRSFPRHLSVPCGFASWCNL